MLRAGRMDDWDNICFTYVGSGKEVASIDECKDVCVAIPDCVQFMLKDGLCEVGTLPKMGHSAPGTDSRWLLARVKEWGEKLGECKENWIESPPES